MGTTSYNTEQERAQLESLGFDLDPNLVILLFAANDIESRMWVFEKRAPRITNLAQRSYAASLLFVLAHAVGDRVLGPEGKHVSVGNYRPDHPRWQSIDRSLTAMNAACRTRGILFVVFSNPQPDSVPFQMVSVVGKREGFPVHSLPPTRPEFTNSTIDRHPNPEGSRRYAEAIHAFLREGSYL